MNIYRNNLSNGGGEIGKIGRRNAVGRWIRPRGGGFGPLNYARAGNPPLKLWLVWMCRIIKMGICYDHKLLCPSWIFTWRGPSNDLFDLDIAEEHDILSSFFLLRCDYGVGV